MKFYIVLLILALVTGCAFNQVKDKGEHDFRWGTCMKCGYVIEGFHWENIPNVCVEKEWVKEEEE